MKKCKYCESEIADDVLQCENCGSKDFINICINCGTEFEDLKCPACGILVGEKPRVCFHCGKKTFEKICPECGADLINKRRVQVNSYSVPAPDYNAQYNPQYNRHSNVLLKPVKKSLFGKIFTAFISICLVAAVVTVVGVMIWSGQRPTISNLVEFKSISKEEHPRFYGDFKEAADLWRGYGNIKVVNAGSSAANKDALLLLTRSNTQSNTIDSIDINLSAVDNKEDIKLEDILELTGSYIPYDILDKYYLFEEAFHETFNAGDYEAYTYVMKINEDGEAVNNLGERHYNNTFAFKIIHRNDNDWLVSMDINSGKGNYKTEKPGVYDVENWDIDIYKYR